MSAVETTNPKPMNKLIYGWHLADYLTELNILALAVGILIVAVIYLLRKNRQHSKREKQLDCFINDVSKSDRDYTKNEIESLKKLIKSNYDNLIFKINSVSNDEIFNKKTLEISARFEKLESRIQDLTPPAGAEKITHKRNNKGQFEKVN